MDFVLLDFIFLNVMWTKDKLNRVKKKRINARIVQNDKNIACCHESTIYVLHSHSGHCRRKCYNL